MRKLSVIGGLLLAVVLGSSCNNQSFEKTGDGLQYRFVERKNGRHATMGDLLKLHLRYRDMKGKQLFDSGTLGSEFVVQLVTPSFIGGIEEGFSMMGEGDSAVFKVSADSVFEKTFRQTLPPSVSKGDYLTFEVRLLKVMNQDEYRKSRTARPKSVSEIEQQGIDFYLAENRLEVKPSRPGVYYIELKKGTGEKPSAGDSIELKYTGSFLSGEVFDGSEKGGKNLTYQLGDGLRLAAWEDAVSSMQEGGISRIVLSSENAYGKDGFGPVPPATTVVYDIELIKVKKRGS